jgi:CheY-like chemotaxis protein
VDDSLDGLLVRKTLLEEMGCRVRVAINGAEGLQKYENEPFDVVVTDYRMPCMDGIELIQRIRHINPSARIILLSGFVEPLGLTEETTGADAVIAKTSLEPIHLVRSLKRLLNRSVRKPAASQKRTAIAAEAAR